MAIVDLGPDGDALPRYERQRSWTTGGAVAAGVALGLAIALVQAPAPIPARSVTLATHATRSVPFASPPPMAAAPLDGPALSLPAGAVDADLSYIPDRYLNDPPAAWFRSPVVVRGVPGLAAAEGIASVMWTEGPYTYSLSSSAHDLAYLIDLARALR